MNLVLFLALLFVPSELKEADQALQNTYVALLEGSSDPGVVSWYGGTAVAGMNAYKNSLTECELLGEIETNRYEAFNAWFTKMNVLVLVLQEPSDTILITQHFLAGASFVREYDAAIEECLDGHEPPPIAADWYLSPDRILEAATGEVTFTDNPLQDTIGANQWSSSGKNRPKKNAVADIIQLAAGEYQHFRITHTYDVKPGVDPDDVNDFDDVVWGQDLQTTIRAETPGTVFITPNPVGGSQTCYLEWGGATTLEGLVFLGDDLNAVGSENPASDRFDFHQGFRDFYFFDCAILGGWNAETQDSNNAPKNKWGVINYMMGASARDNPGWVWLSDRSIEGIWDEHLQYFHNVQGDVFIGGIDDEHRLTARWAGRTFFQMANRIGEGPAGIGNLTFQFIDIEDVCLQSGGGGSAFSFNGRHTGQITLDHVTVRLGANPNLLAPRSENITGAFVCHAGEDTNDEPNGNILITNCSFQVGPAFTGTGAARRGNIQVRECNSFSLTGSRISQLGDNPREALDISPDLVETTITLDDDNDIIGSCIFDGIEYPDYATMLDAIKNHPKVIIE